MSARTRLPALALLLALAVCLAAPLAAQSLLDNPHYRASLDLKAKAQRAFDEGDYDAAADLAARAAESARLSDLYVERELARFAADRALRAAGRAESAALRAGAPALAVPSWEPAKRGYDEARAAFPGATETAAYRSLAEAGRQAEAGFGAALAEARELARDAIARAGERLDGAAASASAAQYPNIIDGARKELAAARSAFGAERFDEAKRRADAVAGILAALPAQAPYPAAYTVRALPVRTDCLWRIAAYPFVYNDPLKWPLLYEANRSRLRDPNNPDLLHPGIELKIPSLAGEERRGLWDPRLSYKDFPKPAEGKK